MSIYNRAIYPYRVKWDRVVLTGFSKGLRLPSEIGHVDRAHAERYIAWLQSKDVHKDGFSKGTTWRAENITLDAQINL